MMRLYTAWDVLRRKVPVPVRRWILSYAPWIRQWSGYLYRRHTDSWSSLLRVSKKLQDISKKKPLADLSFESGRLYVVTPDNFKLWCNEKAINPTLWHHYRGFDHECFERSFLAKFIVPNAVVLDIGANVGLHAMSFAKIDPTVIVHAFEPLPSTFETLCENVRKNDFQAQIQCHNYAVSDKIEELLISNQFGPCDFVIKENCEKVPRKTITVPTITVDSFVEQRELKVSGIKIDVEGFEVYVLEGARNVIRKDRPWIFCECEESTQRRAGKSSELLATFLTSLGYRLDWVNRFTGTLAPFSSKPKYVNNLLARPMG